MSLSAVGLPRWSGKHIDMAEVVKALDELRRSEQKAATRTSVANLIMVARSDAEVVDAEAVIDHLGVRHPARIITLMAPVESKNDPPNVDAEITMHAGEAAGHQIWSDEIRLTVAGAPAMHLASLLRPLLLADLPVVVWYVSGLPSTEDPLLKLSDAVIVDAKTAAGPDEGEPAMHRAFDQIAALTRRHTVIDLSWHRTRTWRQLLAAQFDGEVYRPFVSHVERIEVVGKLGPRTLLAGWLASRLRLERSYLHLFDGRHLSITISCSAGNQRAEFQAERIPGERLVRASARIEGGPSHEEILGLPSDALPDSLSSSLKRLERDRVYEQAIKLAGSWF